MTGLKKDQLETLTILRSNDNRQIRMCVDSQFRFVKFVFRPIIALFLSATYLGFLEILSTGMHDSQVTENT